MSKNSRNHSKNQQEKHFWSAVATLVGTIVGVGIFGLPYVMAKAGFFIGLFFLLILGGVSLRLHLLYSDIVWLTPGRHRLVGYAEYYLGSFGRRLVTFTSLFGFYGSLLAYLIVGGVFLQTLLGGTEFFWSLVFFVFGSIGLFWGLRLISRLEILMTLFLILTVGLIFWKSWFALEIDNLTRINWANFLLPYGVILFALSGTSGIPEIREMFAKGCSVKEYKKAVFLGTLIPIIIYFIFSLAVVGVTGLETSPEAIRGLSKAIGDGIVNLGAVFGFLAVTTSFLVIGLNLKKIFWYDYNWSKNTAWLATCLIPLMLYLANFRNFITIIGTLGAIFGGIEGIILILIYWRVKKQRVFTVWKCLDFVLIFLFVLGILSQFLRLI